MKKGIKLLIILLVIGFLITILYLYAMLFSAKGFVAKEHKIISKTIVQEYDGLKIVHISDIHYGISTTNKDLIKIINDINMAKPDLIFMTGDLIDGEINDKTHNEIANILKKLKATIGKYAVSGNHDVLYTRWSQLISDCDFKNLDDTYDIVYKNSYKSIFISGISDNIYSTKKITDKSQIIFEYLNNNQIDNSIYRILLIHEPDYIDDIDFHKFDLILSGHSHNGQIRIPFIGALYTPKGSKKYYKEFYNLGNTKLYISSGIGTTFLPIRLLNKPSYNLYRIIQKEN